jgi:hypothetical protein
MLVMSVYGTVPTCPPGLGNGGFRIGKADYPSIGVKPRRGRLESYFASNTRAIIPALIPPAAILPSAVRSRAWAC